MTEQQTDQAAPPESQAQEISSLDERLDRLEDLVKRALGGGGSESSPEPEEAAPDVKSETRRAVAEVRRREAAKAAREKEKAESEARLAAVEAKLKEKAPREYRRVTRFMRWEDEDKES